MEPDRIQRRFADSERCFGGGVGIACEIGSVSVPENRFRLVWVDHENKIPEWIGSDLLDHLPRRRNVGGVMRADFLSTPIALACFGAITIGNGTTPASRANPHRLLVNLRVQLPQ